MKHHLYAAVALFLGVIALEDNAARAELVLSQVIVDLSADHPREDIEAWNNGSERAYISVEPFEVLNAGSEAETRVHADDPQVSGILASPRRMILEPGERRNIRIAFVGEDPNSDRVFRLAVKPVAGPISATTDALKVFIGYDALVIVRPNAVHGDVVAVRSGRNLTLRNEGNTSREVFQGEQCNALGSECQALPAKRLYPGASWQQVLPYDTVAKYSVTSGTSIRDRQF
ncbi:hypothetical protein ACWPM1_13095 [Tsuneonella sp. HG249]